MRLEYGNGAITIESHANPAPSGRRNMFVATVSGVTTLLVGNVDGLG